ncbi:MAG: hypothetical protein LBM27_06385, partial [Lactobacillaceae bacterium]|nr:hypothetical protein [Lactobacillaceae bacterium]
MRAMEYGQLVELVKSIIENFEDSKKSLKYVVGNLPIVWFGNLDAYLKSEKRVITVGINPSDAEFLSQRFTTSDSVSDVIESYNNYFENNPYWHWFNMNERVLKQFDTSYKTNQQSNTAIHIDLCSTFATHPTWGKLSPKEQKSLRETGKGENRFWTLVDLLKPDLILISVAKRYLWSDLKDYKGTSIGYFHVRGRELTYYKGETFDMFFGTNNRG